MNLDAYLGILRAVLAAVGGSLMASGAVNSDQWTAITGGIIAALTAAWSIYQHSVVAPAKIVTASSVAAKAAATGSSIGNAAAQGATSAGASDATVASARAATVKP